MLTSCSKVGPCLSSVIMRPRVRWGTPATYQGCFSRYLGYPNPQHTAWGKKPKTNAVEVKEARAEVAAASASSQRQDKCPLCLLGGRIQETGRRYEALLEGGIPRLQKGRSSSTGGDARAQFTNRCRSKRRTGCVLSNQKRRFHAQPEGQKTLVATSKTNKQALTP